jgi:nitrile hydratase accessory protein
VTSADSAGRPLLAAGQPGDEQGPRFVEPWQAESFALTHALADAGLFTWAEWTDALAGAIAAAQASGDPDLGDTYYSHWLAALEGLCASKRALAVPDVDERQEAWRQAYLRTAHGPPVELPG